MASNLNAYGLLKELNTEEVLTKIGFKSTNVYREHLRRKGISFNNGGEFRKFVHYRDFIEICLFLDGKSEKVAAENLFVRKMKYLDLMIKQDSITYRRSDKPNGFPDGKDAIKLSLILNQGLNALGFLGYKPGYSQALSDKGNEVLKRIYAHEKINS